MHFLLHVRLQGFYTRVLGDRYSGRPLVVFREGRVIDASPEALAAGLDVGMDLTAARTLTASGTFVPWDSSAFHAARTQWLDACATFTDVIEPREPHTALFDLSEHPNPQAVADGIVGAVRALGYDVSCGTGGSRWVAELASSFDVGTEPLLRHGAFLKDMSTHCLAPIAPEIRERLVSLGYGRVGDVARLPLEALRDEFGDSAFDVFRAARGGGETSVDSRWPEGSLSSRIGFAGPPQDVLELLEGVDTVAEQLAENLVGRCLQGREIQVFLEHENGRVTALRRECAEPIRNRDQAADCLRSMLAAPPEVPVVGVRVRMTNLGRSEYRRSSEQPVARLSRVAETATALACRLLAPDRNGLLRRRRESAEAA